VSSLYFLDTNMVIYIQRGVPSVLQKLAAIGRSRVALPSLVAAELAYGVEKSAYPAENRRVLELFLQRVTVLIGCQVLAEDGVLVTNNTREFERVEGLKLENWVV
jgi:tRNA(fMet)-specific endonuclease VapC